MSRQITIQVEIPGDLARFRFPRGVNDRLHDLLDKQGTREGLTAKERREAEDLVELAEVLTLLGLKVENALAGRRANSAKTRRSNKVSRPKTGA